MENLRRKTAGQKSVLLGIILLFSFSVRSQVINKTFPNELRIDRVLGVGIDSVSTYHLNVVKDDTVRWTAGNNLILHEDHTFESHYFAPCGLDNFYHSYGTYKWISNNTIEFYIQRIEYGGLLRDKPTDYPEKKYVFKVEQKGKFYTFLKRKE